MSTNWIDPTRSIVMLFDTNYAQPNNEAEKDTSMAAKVDTAHLDKALERNTENGLYLYERGRVYYCREMSAGR